jgi:transcriptional regulator with XRE-family HTH domain
MASLKDKIEALILGLGLSSTRFADLIDVKRPIISHILNGRNKPSLDIIQKIVDKFPELEYNWIGEDQDLDLDIVHEIRRNLNARDFDGLNQYQDETEIFNSQAESKTERNIVKVLFFYDDETFKAFSPESLGFLN